MEGEHPLLKETLLSAMGNVDGSRLLDTRLLNLEGESPEAVSEDFVEITLR